MSVIISIKEAMQHLKMECARLQKIESDYRSERLALEANYDKLMEIVEEMEESENGHNQEA